MQFLARYDVFSVLVTLSAAEVRGLSWQKCEQIRIHLTDGAADGIFISFLCFLLFNQIVL